MNNVTQGMMMYTSADEFASSYMDMAPATTTPVCAVGTIVILTAGSLC